MTNSVNYELYLQIINNYNNILTTKLPVILRSDTKLYNPITKKTYKISNNSDLHKSIKLIIGSPQNISNKKIINYKKCSKSSLPLFIDIMVSIQYVKAVENINFYINLFIGLNTKYKSVTFTSTLEPNDRRTFKSVDILVQINISDIDDFINAFSNHYSAIIYACTHSQNIITFLVDASDIEFPVVLNLIFVKSLPLAKLYYSYYGWILQTYYSTDEYKLILSCVCIIKETYVDGNRNTIIDNYEDIISIFE